MKKNYTIPITTSRQTGHYQMPDIKRPIYSGPRRVATITEIPNELGSSLFGYRGFDIRRETQNA